MSKYGAKIDIVIAEKHESGKRLGEAVRKKTSSDYKQASYFIIDNFQAKNCGLKLDKRTGLETPLWNWEGEVSLPRVNIWEMQYCWVDAAPSSESKERVWDKNIGYWTVKLIGSCCLSGKNGAKNLNSKKECGSMVREIWIVFIKEG